MTTPDAPATADPEPGADPDTEPATAPAVSPDRSADGLRVLIGHTTQQLLGATMQITDEQWRAPSRLPGWSRGHVASHLARNADGIAGLADGARLGERRLMYASREQRETDIEAGSGRSGLDLQVDLDSSAGRLDAAFAALTETGGWDTLVDVRGTDRPASLLPLMRLGEVALHHVDLDVGHEIDDLDPDTVGWLLEYIVLRQGDRPDMPRIEVRGDNGFHASLGTGEGEPRTVTGPDAALLGWLTRRTGTDRLTGADELELPSFA